VDYRSSHVSHIMHCFITKHNIRRYVFLEEIAHFSKMMYFNVALDNNFGFSSLQLYLIIVNRLQSFKWKLLNETFRCDIPVVFYKLSTKYI